MTTLNENGGLFAIASGTEWGLEGYGTVEAAVERIRAGNPQYPDDSWLCRDGLIGLIAELATAPIGYLNCYGEVYPLMVYDPGEDYYGVELEDWADYERAVGAKAFETWG